MKDKKFMDQKVKDLSIKELAKSILVKLKDKPEEPKEPEKELTAEEEINKYPERFETLGPDCLWVPFSSWPKMLILNSKWNYHALNNKIFYMEKDGAYRELIRRKGVFK